ncbi:uncharacterized protein LOC123448583 isoform X3 [Hordeum vulgare subsp. vulgare]|uniref:uncharacterized protein LOC123448583 isoform X3 n=1 Tax=Hordeum vulgare subsp. vulgare TaxID=112509 RepID=UPI001D1A4C85|nr:uncharacterized protein LOC123448583 isoform X3 [Hordeum vulgare subsp. vulgare]
MARRSLWPARSGLELRLLQGAVPRRPRCKEACWKQRGGGSMRRLGRCVRGRRGLRELGAWAALVAQMLTRAQARELHQCEIDRTDSLFCGL